MSPRRQNTRARGTSGNSVRAGFTLVELLVAMMMFAVGMLALASTAAGVTRMMGGATRQTLAANVAQSRLERIRSSKCSTLTSGIDTVRGVISTWTVQAVTRGVNVTETIVYPTPKGTRTRTYNTTLSC